MIYNILSDVKRRSEIFRICRKHRKGKKLSGNISQNPEEIRRFGDLQGESLARGPKLLFIKNYVLR